MAKTRAQITADAHQRAADKGLRRVRVWAYEEDRDRVLAYAAKLRKKREADK